MNRLIVLIAAGFLVVFAALAAEPQLVVKVLKGAVEDGKAVVSLEVCPAAGSIADFLTAESVISRFTDNLGNDLCIRPAGKQAGSSTLPYYTGASQRGGDKEYTVSVVSSVNASTNARSFTLAGELRVAVADSARINEIKSLVIRDGTAFSFGQLQGKVDKVKMEDGRLEFTMEVLNVGEDFQLHDVEISNAAGERVHKSSNKMWSNSGEGKGTYALQFYGIEGNPGPFNVKWKQWVGVKEARVPYSVTVPVGGVPVVGTNTLPAQASGGLGSLLNALAVPVNVDNQSGKLPPLGALVNPPQGAWPLLKVTEVTGKGQGGSVVINDRTLHTGETIGGVSIEAIANGGVVLCWQGELKRLRKGQATR